MSASRLTAFPRPVAVAPLTVGPLAMRRLGEQYLVTGETGGYSALSPKDLESFLAGELVKDSALWKEVQGKGLVKDYIDFQAAFQDTLDRRLLVWPGPCVHRFEVTERTAAGAPGAAMTLETARAAVDWAFNSPSTSLWIEFAGGQPLLNWPVVSFVIRYAGARAAKEGRKVAFALHSLPALMDARQLDFLLLNKVTLHLQWGGAQAADLLAKAVARTTGEHEGFAPKPVAVVPVARTLRGQEAAIVDELIRLGVESVTFAYAAELADPEEYAAFYRAAFDHLVKRGLKRKTLRETAAVRFLARILSTRQWAFPELEPVDRIAFDAAGGVHFFDSGTAGAADVFKVGDAAALSWNAALNAAAVAAGLQASVLDAQPLCSQCAYKPYCGTDPSAAARTQGSLWGRLTSNDRCRVHMAVLDVLFARVQEWEVRENLFSAWLKSPSV